ncbi:MAG: glycosyltransferase [Nitrospinaceae bacterium]|nr:glycosyltransferase [Nitrospinaceae bacterium]NIR56125.1 glycosyltransferase [Nitrospinaceae bacterium]NIS86573.1 glycosyltransferase [Nitrospinaceae bacterium]NIT83407.1 glycosyltransferase [Nitrospinaceae bacterium]NIU45617.1 glycosyltransferase [Nitrospinaceae bacterium]
MIWYGWLMFLIWLFAVVRVVPVIRHRHLEKLAGTKAPKEGFPKLSVILSARDEELDIEQCLQSILSTRYPHLELITINDRSTDRTGEIIDRIAAQDSRVHPVHIETLPEGWLGKNHALHQGARQAKGEILLFTDGDIMFEPDCFSRAVNYVRASRVDHLCLFPGGMECPALEGVFKAFFMFAYLLTIKFVEPVAGGKYHYFGMGAFNMVTREAYDAVGGFATIRMDVVDDLQLGRLVKESGRRQEILFGIQSLALHWQRGLWACIKGLEKNLFAVFEYNWGLALTVMLGTVFVYLSGYIGLFLFPDPASYGFIGALVLMHGLFAYLASQYAGRGYHNVLLPLAVILEIFAMIRSSWKTWRQGGVYWRDTFYSLDTLKEARYRSPAE